jgi:hypothetical protein
MAHALSRHCYLPLFRFLGLTLSSRSLRAYPIGSNAESFGVVVEGKGPGE